MNLEEPVQYLVNLLIVINSDNNRDKNEINYFYSIAKENNISDSIINQALKIIDDGNGKYRPLKRYSENVRSLEDMFFVSMVDNIIQKSEKEFFKDIKSKIGIPKSVWNKILKETIPRVRKFQAISWKFEDFKDNSETSYTINKPNQVVIHFSRDLIPEFKKIITLSELSDNLTTFKVNNELWYQFTFPINAIHAIFPMIELINKIEKKRIYIGDVEKNWDDFFEFYPCAVAKENKENYCFLNDDNTLNIFGCKKCSFKWTKWNRFYSCGKFSKSDNKYTFDKQMIKNGLKLELSSVINCPFLNFEYILTVLENFPEEIDLSKDKTWRYHCASYSEPKNEETSRNEKNNNEYIDGVIPLSRKEGVNFIHKCMKECQLPIIIFDE